MTVKNTLKALTGALLVALAMGFTGCKCCAEEQASSCGADPACDCPTLMVIQMDETLVPEGKDAKPCHPCTGNTKDHKAKLCMNAVAACPMYSCMILESAPLCDGCKAKVMECAKARKACGVCGKDAKPCEGCKAKMHKMPVRALITPEAMKAHTNCKKCMDKVQDHVKAAKKSGDNAAPGAVIVVEEMEVDAVETPAPAPAPAPAAEKKDAATPATEKK